MRRLARWRVPLGFLFAAVVLWLAAPTTVTLAVGSAVAVFGEAIRVWAAGHLNKAREVTTSGPYRWFAHPLYVGSSVIGLGVAIAANSVVVAPLVAVYLVATLTAAIRSEEAYLHERFGAAYEAYRRAGRVDEQRRFSVRQAIANHEHRAVGGLVVAVLLLLLKATYNGLFWGASR